MDLEQGFPRQTMAILRLTVVNVSIRMAYVCCICTFTLKYPPAHDLVGSAVFYLVSFRLLPQRRRSGA